MTIWEMERKSGLERSNIRFYEKEGLLTPERRENGYREYTEENLQMLLRIKLLRRLGFSIEAIRSLQQGSTAMEEVLAQRLGAITEERGQLNATEQVCIEMRQDGAVFDSLDAQRYLNSYDRALNLPAEVKLRPNVPASDRIQPTPIPWRRYFARMLDMSIVSLFVYGVLALGFRVNMQNIPDIVTWLVGFLEWGMMIPLEAWCIYQFGTTPGKAIMGISITDENERPLSFGRAAERTWEVFIHGFGANIPFYSVYRSWKSYKGIKNGEEMEWDYRLTVTAKEYRHWRTVVYIAVWAALVGLLILVSLAPMMPVNRGELTVGEFVENYNQLSQFHSEMDAGTLRSDGTLDFKHPIDAVNSKELVQHEEVRLRFDEEDLVLQSVVYGRIDASLYAAVRPDQDGKRVIQNTIMALAWADTNMFTALKTQPVLDEFYYHREGTLEREVLGWRIIYTITPDGDMVSSNGDVWDYHCDVSFSMTKIT